MIRNILVQRFAANLAYTHQLVGGLTEEQTDHAPVDGMTTPRWVVGHLVQVADQITLGWVLEQPRSLEPWDAWFGMGTYPRDLPDQAPTLAVGLQELERLHGVISECVKASSPDLYERTIPASVVEGFRERFGTIGNALTHTMLLHEMQHLGQLSAWRRAQGMPEV